MNNRSTLRFAVPAVVVLMGVTACADVAGPGEGGSTPLSIGFAVAPGTAFGAAAPASGSWSFAFQPLLIEGTNGTLAIESLRLIVAEFEVEGTVGACEGVEAGGDGTGDDHGEDDGGDDDCEEFEAPPAFVDVPLSGGPTVAVTREVPAGIYRELEFKVEGLENDDPGGDEAALLAQIRAEIPDWPSRASLMLEGTFTPTGGAPIPFRTFAGAEIEVEMELNPPLDLAATDADRLVTVEIDPAAWLLRPDGTVLDLSQLDYATTGRVMEFEVELEHGFERAEHDDH